MQHVPEFKEAIKGCTSDVHPVVAFDTKKEKLLLMDFTKRNTDLTEGILQDTALFSQYIQNKLQNANAKYGIGGYDEHRTIYRRSEIFDAQSTYTASERKEEGEPRRLHLGIDIWGEAGTAVSAPIEGTVHSYAFNNAFGDYGATIILQHQCNGFLFHTLYGHLNVHALQYLKETQQIEKGQPFAAFGNPHENGHWPPHLHFQLIMDMQGYKGDYPGVCALPDREGYLANCPDPDLLLGLMAFAKEC